MKKQKLLCLFVFILLSIATISCTKSEDDDPGSNPTIPVVTTDELGTPTYTTVEIWGSVTSSGGTYIDSFGFCWSTEDETPTVEDDKIEYSGNQLGQYHVNLGELDEATTYYIRAFARNSAGIGYGE